MGWRLTKALQRRFGIAAPQVAVRPHLPWYWRWLGFAALAAAIGAAGWATYDFGMEFAGFRRSEAERALEQLRRELAARDAELAAARAKLAEAERQLEIERATYGNLSGQVKALAEENATLKEDLAFFQSLMAGGGREGAISVNRFRVEREAVPGEYRYRLLLVQSGQRAKEFKGELRFVLHLEQGGRPLVLLLPPESERHAKEFQVSFRFFQRIEGTFRIAPDAVLHSMQVRVYENGAKTPKLTHTVKLS